MDIMTIMEQRHSVRQYKDVRIESEKLNELRAMAEDINRRTGLHIQLCCDEPKCFDSFMAHYGKFTGVKNYIALVGKKSVSLEEQLGYYGEQLVLRAQELGLNTCWVAMTHGKSSAEVKKGEKLGCIISLGYGENVGVPHSSKPMEELCKADEMPEWFKNGMKGAMLAPTAMNQQKFKIELLPSGEVRATCGKGFYTKLDLGIVKYHFEAASGRKI